MSVKNEDNFLLVSIVDKIKSNYNTDAIKGMARYGINTKKAYGMSMPELRKMGKEFGKNHYLALKLWETQIHEAQILGSLIDDDALVTEEQMERWVADFDSWDVCDQVCGNLFYKSPFAKSKIYEWCNRKEEFVKRAGFVLIAEMAVKDKKADNEFFTNFFPLIIDGALDHRNFVKKAVNWALRQIGKRNEFLRVKAIETAEKIKSLDSKSARWIANDAIRELSIRNKK